MDRFEIDRKTIDFLYRLFKKGRITLQPSYQRSRVWSDDLRYNLIDSIKEEFPIGLVMLNVIPHVDPDGSKIEKFDVVDGQQRMSTIFEYVDGARWATVLNKEGFSPYAKLSEAAQSRFMEYQIPISFMKEFEQEEITECYNRLQKGKALKVGEKIKSMITHKAHAYVEELTKHRIFDVGDGKLKVRDTHWTLATAFLKSIYKDDLLGRQEYKQLEDFMRSKITDSKIKKSLEESKKILNFVAKALDEALRQDSQFEKYLKTPRVIKWVFVCISKLLNIYSISGREHLVAKGVLQYYKLVTTEGTDEWAAYLNTGRTGRIDTGEVRACLVQLTNFIITATDAEPLDTQRFFTPDQRRTIFKNSKGSCAECNTELSETNFHADHKKPHSQGGPTTVGNGQALCSKCNRSKGKTWKEIFEVAS